LYDDVLASEKAPSLSLILSRAFLRFLIVEETESFFFREGGPVSFPSDESVNVTSKLNAPESCVFSLQRTFPPGDVIGGVASADFSQKFCLFFFKDFLRKKKHHFSALPRAGFF